MAHELPFIAAINEAIMLEMERDETVLYFGQNMATTENEPYVDAFGKDRVRVTPISETAEIGIAIGAALAGFRPVVELYMAEFMLVAMDQVVNEGEPLPRDERRPGEGSARAQGRLRLHRRLGRPAHRHDQRALHGRPRPQGRRAVDGRRRQGPDGDRDPRRQPGRLPAQLPAHARARRGAGRRVPRPVRPGRDPARGQRRDDRRHGLDASTARSAPPSSWPRRASRPR